MRRFLKILLYVVALLVLAIVALNWTYGRLPGEPKPRGSFTTVDGVRIHYLERSGGGTPVILLHGLPGTAEDWNEVTPLLAGHRTIAIDRPGFGYSGNGYMKFERQLEVLRALIVQLHVQHPILVGHSYGGTMSLGFAERYPGVARGLVLVDAAAAGTHVAAFEHLQAHFVNFLQLPVVRPIANATFSQLLRTITANLVDGEAFDPQPVAPAHKHRVLAISMTSGNLKAYAGEELEANDVFARIDPRLATIDVPAIVIQGEQDQLVKPVYGRRLASELPNARLEMIHGGHMAPYTHPYAVATAVGTVERASWPRTAQTPPQPRAKTRG